MVKSKELFKCLIKSKKVFSHKQAQRAWYINYYLAKLFLADVKKMANP
jgi:hypothetical protein